MLMTPEPEIVGMMRRYEEATAATRRDLVTMDLLGGGRRRCLIDTTSNSNKESDVHRLLSLPLGWERRLQLLSGEALGGASDDDHRSNNIRAWTKVTTLSRARSSPSSSPSGLPPPPPPSLDLKLFTPGMECPSVCTLDKVKLALDRIKDPRQTQSIRSSSSPTSSSSTTASSGRQKRRRPMMGDGKDEKERQGTDSESCRSEEDAAPGLQAAGCPSCLSYVLIARGSPRCHRCNSTVHVPPAEKKRKIDLNSH